MSLQETLPRGRGVDGCDSRDLWNDTLEVSSAMKRLNPTCGLRCKEFVVLVRQRRAADLLVEHG